MTDVDTVATVLAMGVATGDVSTGVLGCGSDVSGSGVVVMVTSESIGS